MSELIFEIDKKVILNYSWKKLVNLYTKDKSSQILVDDVNINVEHVISYLSSFRKILVQYYINQGIKKYIPFDKYLKFAGRELLENLIEYKDYGSVTITSDYDVSLAGPGVNIILRRLIEEFISQTSKTPAHAFDTNIYIAPELIVRDTNLEYLKSKIENFEYYEISNKMTENGIIRKIVPIPNHPILIEMEWNRISTKMKTHSELTIENYIEKYRKLFDLADTLDYVVYQMKEEEHNPLNKESFFRILFQINHTSIESYSGLSTILVIVYGLQKKQNELIRKLKPINFLVSAYENLIELNNLYITIDMKTLTPNMALKLTKYLLRVLTCISLSKIHHNFKDFEKYRNCCDKLITEKKFTILTTPEFIKIKNNFFNVDFHSPHSILLQLYIWLNQQRKIITRPSMFKRKNSVY